MTNIPNPTTTIPIDNTMDVTTYITSSSVASSMANIGPITSNAYVHTPLYPMHGVGSNPKPAPETVKGEFAIYETQADYAVSAEACEAWISESEDRLRDIKMKLAIRLAEGMIENNLIHFFYQDDHQRDIRKFTGRAILMDKDSIKKARPR